MNWIDKEVAFYDFIWAYGVGAHTNCINDELYEDFKAGGNKFEEMKKAILKKFSTRKIAVKEFENEATPPDPQHGREPEPKSLAQYLDEYIEHEYDKDNIGEGVDVLYAWDSWRELLQQALDAYESTENVTIKIERNMT